MENKIKEDANGGRKRLAGVLRWIERALFAAGLVAFGYCAFFLTDSWLFQRRAKRQLQKLSQSLPTMVIASSSESQAPTPPRVRPGSLIGRIDVPRLGVDVAIAEGTDAATLRHAAGHITGTALPGQPGNVGIAAHRDTFFRPLKYIRKDDVISVETPTGDYRYRVVSTRIVTPETVSVLNSDGTDVLTLVTCYPFNYIGAAPRRFIVRAEQIG